MQGSALWALIEGVRNGTGTSYERNGQVTYDGEWKNGKREGFGISGPPGGEFSEYEGEWKDDNAHGTGKSFFPKFRPGTEEQFVAYEGQWRDNPGVGPGHLLRRGGQHCLPGRVGGRPAVPGRLRRATRRINLCAPV